MVLLVLLCVILLQSDVVSALGQYVLLIYKICFIIFAISEKLSTQNIPSTNFPRYEAIEVI